MIGKLTKMLATLRDFEHIGDDEVNEIKDYLIAVDSVKYMIREQLKEPSPEAIDRIQYLLEKI